MQAASGAINDMNDSFKTFTRDSEFFLLPEEQLLTNLQV